MNVNQSTQIVTKWYRVSEDGSGFNHISTGYNPDHDSPAWVSEEQRRAWANATWFSEPALLIDGEVVPYE